MAFFQVAAVDLDGTLTSGGRLCVEALDAIDQVRRNGLQVVLVTGRIGAELAAEFPDIADHVDGIVLENGAVAVTDGQAHRRAAPVDRVLDDALAARGVLFRRGEVLLAIDEVGSVHESTAGGGLLRTDGLDGFGDGVFGKMPQDVGFPDGVHQPVVVDNEQIHTPGANLTAETIKAKDTRSAGPRGNV